MPKNQQGLSQLVIIVLVVAVFIGAVLYSSQLKKSQNQSLSQPSQTLQLDYINGVPIYPGSKLSDFHNMPACSSFSEVDMKRAKSFFKCDTTQYTYITSDNIEKVVAWYTNDESKSGWTLGGGGGVEGTERYGVLLNGETRYWTNITTNGVDTTTIEIRFPITLTAPDEAVSSFISYEDKDYGFLVKYPASWNVKNISDTKKNYDPKNFLRSIELKEPPSPGGGGFGGLKIEVLENSSKSPLSDFLSENYGATAQNYKPNSDDLGIKTEWLINRQEPGAGPGQMAYISEGDRVISLYCGDCSSNLFDQILLSFK